VPPTGGAPTQLTRNPSSVTSAFTWSPDGRFLAHTMDRSLCVTDAHSGKTVRLTAPADETSVPRPEACVYSPDGKKIACVRRVPSDRGTFNQVFVSFLPQGLSPLPAK
jgi:Tol biopolymer transport system component